MIHWITLIYLADGSTDYNCCAYHLLASLLNFLVQTTVIAKAVEERGHIFKLYPKYHCECNFIERHWGATKRFARETCDYSYASLKKRINEILDSVELAKVRRFERKAWQYVDAYYGIEGDVAEEAVRLHKSHRRLRANQSNEDGYIYNRRN